MEKLSDKVGPGTAGVAQRIYVEDSEKYSPKSKKSEEQLYALRINEVMPCRRNQY